jgi:hypothetical protein
VTTPHYAFLVAAVIAAVIAASAAGASAADFALSAGALELVSPSAPHHLGVYGYVAASVVVPSEHVTLVSSVGIEGSPELGAWGLIVGIVADFPVSDHVGVDAIATFVHDQIGERWNEAAFYAGAGAGVSFFVDRWTISPSVVALGGLNVGGWTLAPGINLAFTL